jgi:acyl-CoA synthetase (AMP-forming)/AMP-acid ligase II
MLSPGRFAMTSTSADSEIVNVAARLTAMAERYPQAVAIAMPGRYGNDGKRQYQTISFQDLDRDSDRLARGLRELGVRPGMRMALLVKPSIDFISLVFALFKSGAVSILIDPGMGRKNLLACLDEAQPEGFVAMPIVHAVRTLLGRRYERAKHHVTVGRRWFWGGVTIDQLRGRPWTGSELHPSKADDPAAIIFTTGSTGPPKGVLYRHGNFDRQVTEIQGLYGIEPGEIDLPGFPLFGLFNCAMGVTTVIPDMDPSRPARVDPAKIVEAVHDWQVTQAFGSPAIWNRVGPYCLRERVQLPTLRRVLSAGAPVPPSVLEKMKACIAAEGEIHTPYGATEALPVASISASEVLGETKAAWARGSGTCVGRRFPGIEWKIIRACDSPLPTIDRVEELPRGEIGELIVRGPVVTREYVTRIEANAWAKITDGTSVWHRMGDVGYLDERERFWFCGRMAHRVQTATGPMYTIPCEAIYNQHPAIFRSALVGVGPIGQQQPVMICEPHPVEGRRFDHNREALVAELRTLGQANPLTLRIHDILLHPSFPVDIRHNAKIFREKLAVWAAGQLRKKLAGNERK